MCLICLDGEDCCPVQTILHTGDMRWQSWMQQHPALASCQVDLLYMDTTYCLPKHTFPSQVSAAVIVRAQNMYTSSLCRPAATSASFHFPIRHCCRAPTFTCP